jgi:hypothetical protein
MYEPALMGPLGLPRHEDVAIVWEQPLEEILLGSLNAIDPIPA